MLATHSCAGRARPRSRSLEDERAALLTGWTLIQIKDGNLQLEAYCQTEGCGLFYVFDLDALIGSVGPDYRLPEFAPDMDCSECGGLLKFMLAAMPPDHLE